MASGPGLNSPLLLCRVEVRDTPMRMEVVIRATQTANTAQGPTAMASQGELRRRVTLSYIAWRTQRWRETSRTPILCQCQPKLEPRNRSNFSAGFSGFMESSDLPRCTGFM